MSDDREGISPATIALHVMDGLHEGCQVIGFDFRYLYVNGTVATQAHRTPEELIGKTMMECFRGIDQSPMFEVLQRSMAARSHERMENEFDFPDGSKGWFELRFIPVPEGVCILSLDVTEGKRTATRLAQTEEQFRHAQKMEAVGRLAGGVAHDFNNMLSVVLSYASLLIEDLGDDHRATPDLLEIRKAAERAAALTSQLLVFSRKHVLDVRVVDLNALISDMDKMLRRLIGEDIALTTITTPDLGKVKTDAGQMEHVIMNLVVNARDAMPRGGALTVETANVELGSSYTEGHWGMEAGSYVMLAVSDTGEGMDKATRERIFEPFFTTKERGKGTGLGLSTVFGIVRQSGGHVWVYSEPGKGTTFKIYLPRTGDAATQPARPVPVASLRGSETILLVDDDEPLRVVAREVLRRSGYHVLDAGNGEEAVRLSEQHAGTVHLLISDVVMPGQSGPDLGTRILAVRPDTRVLFMSGYTDDALMYQHESLGPDFSLLQKPITPDALLRRVREMLDLPDPA